MKDKEIINEADKIVEMFERTLPSVYNDHLEIGESNKEDALKCAKTYTKGVLDLLDKQQMQNSSFGDGTFAKLGHSAYTSLLIKYQRILTELKTR